jgi:hypothetical protein
MTFQHTSPRNVTCDRSQPRWLMSGADTGSIVADGTTPAGLVEAFIQGKSPVLPSEDALVITERHIAVIDGMSSPLKTKGQTPSGRVFAQAAALAIRDLRADITAGEAVKEITQRLQGIHAGHDGPVGAVAAIYSVRRREVWRVGDVHVAIGDDIHPATKDVDKALEDYRAAVNAAALAAGVSLQEVIATDPGLGSAEHLLSVQPALANRVGAFGYGVLNGSAVPEQFIEILPVPTEASQLVLASDGYLGPVASFASAEGELLNAMGDDPAGIGLLRQMAKCTKPGNNAPDDRAYLRVAFNASSHNPPHQKEQQ